MMLIVIVVDLFSCRHAAISKYFGDPAPLCNSSCDYCHNPATVKKLSADAKLGTASSSNPKRHRVGTAFHWTRFCFVQMFSCSVFLSKSCCFKS